MYFFFFFFKPDFFSLFGCESFYLPCSSLILLNKKTCVWTYCNNKCCFLDVNCIVGEGLNLSATNFTSVCVCVYVTKLREEKKKKKKDDNARGGRGTLPNRPISTCHSRFFNQTWLSTCFFVLFLYLKKKRRDGMSRGVLPFYSLTLWFEGAFFHPRIISTHYNIPSHGSVWTPQCKTCSVTLFLSSSSECFLLSCAGERVHERVCNCVCACGCVLVEKCTKQIRYKINDILCHFFSVGKIYIYIGIDIVLPSVFLRCFCTIFVPKNGNCSTKISIYICLVSVFSEENKNGVSSALGMSWRSKMTWFSFFFFLFNPE